MSETKRDGWMRGEMLGIILAFLIQGGAMIYWGGQISRQVETNSREIAQIQAREAERAALDSRQDSRLASVETSNTGIIASLARIEDKIDNLMMDKISGRRR